MGNLHEAAHHLFSVLGAPGVGEADERAVDGNPRAPLQLQDTYTHNWMSYTAVILRELNKINAQRGLMYLNQKPEHSAQMKVTMSTDNVQKKMI